MVFLEVIVFDTAVFLDMALALKEHKRMLLPGQTIWVFIPFKNNSLLKLTWSTRDIESGRFEAWFV